MECSRCSTHVYGDGSSDAYEERGEPVTDDERGLVWCDKQCQDNDTWYHGTHNKRNAA
jgi:hypothetical protein